jgi:hypothetical protein
MATLFNMIDAGGNTIAIGVSSYEVKTLKFKKHGSFCVYHNSGDVPSWENPNPFSLDEYESKRYRREMEFASNRKKTRKSKRLPKAERRALAMKNGGPKNRGGAKKRGLKKSKK